MPETPPRRVPSLHFLRFANPSPGIYGSFRCPECNVVGVVDEDQARGRVSIQDGCSFHETLVLESPGAE